MTTEKKILLGAFFVFCLAFSALWFLEARVRPRAIDGLYFQKWSSDNMMQALPAKALKAHPVKALWYLHKEPPGFDAIRALLLLRHDSKDPDKLLGRLDKDLYLLYMFIFAALTCFIFVWTARASSPVMGFAAALIWIAHPAPLFYATLLDSTLLSASVMTWFFYELYRLDKNVSLSRFTLSFLVVFFTKIIFQWFSFPVIILALLLKKIPLRKIAFFSLIAGTVMFGFMFKQHALFGTWSTTTFNGQHFCSIIDYIPSDSEISQLRSSITSHYPEEASRYAHDVYNSRKQWEDNLINERGFKDELLRHPAKSLAAIWESFKYNWGFYWKPSSDYLIFTKGFKNDIIAVSDKNILTDSLPWKKSYEFVFSNSRFIGLLLFSMLVWLVAGMRTKKENYFRNGLSLFLPAAYVVTICCLANIREWTESERLKFILEPVFFIFIACQLYRMLRLFKR